MSELKKIPEKKLPEKKLKKFRRVLNETRQESRFDQNKNYIQHGRTSVRTHCINVAQTSYYIAHRFRIPVNEKALIRGALLHDYFLYDWHENNLKNKIHGFTHPGTALKEASKDFDLSPVEQDMIVHHMFPLTPTPPRSREGVILCIADKLCALKETLETRIG